MKHSDERIEKLLCKLASPNLSVIDLSLGRIKNLLSALGNPHERLQPVVHVAGTNGKGSLIAYLTAILESAGYKVSRLTSPYLVRFNEEIYLNGQEISDEYLLELLQKISAYSVSHPVTFFEAGTALAFMAFSETASDIVLLETGLGGRLDATNMVSSPMVTAITPVSIDHSEFLGNTIAGIAGEKAGIIKQNVPCVIGPQLPEAAQVFENRAKHLGASLSRFGIEWNVEYTTYGFNYISGKRNAHLPAPNLAGSHQLNNAATAIACIDSLQGFTVTNNNIEQGITSASWPARLQLIKEGRLAGIAGHNNELWLDGGHNPSAAIVLADWIKKQKKPVHIICGMLKNKDAREFIAIVSPFIKSFTGVAIDGKPDCYNPDQLAVITREYGIKSSIGADIAIAIQAIANEECRDCIILICGSLYLAGNILWQNNLRY